MITWFAENSVAANLLMITIVAAGIASLPRLKQEVFPELRFGVITITVAYPGAGPAVVEEAICIRIEEAIHGLDGIQRITSLASEEMGVVTAELLDGVDVRRLLDEIKGRIDAVRGFPPESETPVVQEVIARSQVSNLVISGDLDERNLKIIGRRVRDELAALPSVSQVDMIGDRRFEIAVEVPEAALRRHGITYDDVVSAIRRSSLDLPGGAIRTESGEILLRTKGQAYKRADFEQIVLLSRADGSRLHLGQIAEIVDGFKDVDYSVRFNGERAVVVRVFRVGTQNVLDIGADVTKYVANARHRMPPGVELAIWFDETTHVKSRQEMMLRNGRNGFILVLIILVLFLSPRVAFWTPLGIPVSILGTLALMPIFDVSVNIVTTFALVLILGILVDDSIMTGENIHAHQLRDRDSLRAAITGTHEIALPVIFGVLTTMAAFAPLLLLGGALGSLVRPIPIVVISALGISLIESKLVLPTHLARGRLWPAMRRISDGPIIGSLIEITSSVTRACTQGLEYFTLGPYRRCLLRCIQWRYLTLAVGLGILLITAGYIKGGHLLFNFLPHIESSAIAAHLTMAPGTPANVTLDAASKLETAAQRVASEFPAQSQESGTSAVRGALTTLGEQPLKVRISRRPGSLSVGQGSHIAEVFLDLVPSEMRAAGSIEIANRWRELTPPIENAMELTFLSTMFSTGESINVELRGIDMDQLRAAATQLEKTLATYQGIHGIANSLRDGPPELELDIRPSAEALGLSLFDLAQQVRQAFHGEEVQRFQRGRDEVRVMVRSPKARQASLSDLDSIRIRLPDGTAVPFSAVARGSLKSGISEIRRVDRQRVIIITADVDQRVANANEIVRELRSDVLPRIASKYSGVGFGFEGQQREQREAMASIRVGLTLSVLAIFALLAIPLRSYIQPIVIMSVVPFAAVGGTVGHLILGLDASMLSVIGIMAAVGVVVNDSLILVNYANNRCVEGHSPTQAIVLAGMARLRPIVLTSATTFVGLIPVILDKSVQAQFLVPMAVSIAFGILFATVVTLLILPIHYLIATDLKYRYRSV